MTVTTESGRSLMIPAHHQVFWPVEQRFRPGDVIDPATVEVDSDRAATLRRGDRLILDNKVERVAAVAMA